MPRPAWYLFAAAILTLALGGYWIGTLAQPHPAPDLADDNLPASIDFPEYPSLQPLLENLSSPDPAVKADALRQLANLPSDRRNELRRLADKTLLPDVADLLTRRAAEMDLQVALDPPPISLHVHRADLHEVASALSTATDTEVRAIIAPGRQHSFSLDVDRQPFWEVVSALHQQFPLAVGGMKGLALIARDPGFIKTTSLRGPFILYADSASSPDRLMFGLAADPRTPFLGQRLTCTIVTTTGAKFDVTEIFPSASDGGLQALEEHNFLQGAIKLQPFHDAHPGAAIAAYQFHARLAVGLKFDDIEIRDVENHVNELFTAGDSLICVNQRSIREVFARAKAVWFTFSARHHTQDAFASYRILASSGEILGVGSILGRGTTWSVDAAAAPFTLKARVASEIKLFDLDFQLPPPP